MTKRLRIPEEAHELLDQVRGPGETLSDVVRRLARAELKRRLFDRDGGPETGDAEAQEWKAATYRARDGSEGRRSDAR